MNLTGGGDRGGRGRKEGQEGMNGGKETERELSSTALSGKSDSLLILADDFPTPPPTPQAAAAARPSAAAARRGKKLPSSRIASETTAATVTAAAGGGGGGGGRRGGGERKGKGKSLPSPPTTQSPSFTSLFRKSYPPLIEGNLPLLHPLRLPAILLLDSIVWDAGTLVLVLFNAVCLAFYRPALINTSTLAQIILTCEIFCQICFTNELFVKLLALGVVKFKNSYFRDPWNVFDFLVLVAGWLALYATLFSSSSLPSSSSIHGPLMVFGVLRVLRPFRLLNLLPELKRLSGAVVLALPSLTTLMSLAFMVFLALSLVGMQLLQGKFNQECYMPIGGYWESSNAIISRSSRSSSSGSDGDVWLKGAGAGAAVGADGRGEKSMLLCSMTGGKEGGRACPAGGWECKDGREVGRVGPNGGWTSFDNVWVSLLTIFQCMTREGWSDVMYWARQSGGGLMVYVFFILILLLSFFLFQLIVVFVIVNYAKSQSQGEKVTGGQGGRDGGVAKVSAVSDRKEGARKKGVVLPLMGEEGSEGGKEGGKEGGILQTKLDTKNGDFSELLISKLLAIKAGARLEALTSLPPSLPPSFPPASSFSSSVPKEGGVNVRVGEISLLLQRALRHLQLAPQHSLPPSYFRLRRNGEEDGEEEGEDEEGEAGPLMRTGKGGRKKREVDPSKVSYEESPGTYICAAIARSQSFYYFGHFITLLSALLLSLAHYGMSPILNKTLTTMNNFLVFVFCLEVLIKVRGWGWRRYKDDVGGAGVDLLVVVVSLLELFLGGTSSRSYALRCVRLVRLFGLGRDLDMGFRKAMDNVVYTASISLPFLLLLGTFLCVFAIGGMTFLGGKLMESDSLTGLPVPARMNFDSFYWSVISVFQIMTLDDWNKKMYMAMTVTDSALAVGYYVSAVLIGKYGLLNLLTAILVYNYGLLQEEEEEEEGKEKEREGKEGRMVVVKKEEKEEGRELLPPMWVYVWQRLPFRKCFSTGKSSGSSSSNNSVSSSSSTSSSSSRGRSGSTSGKHAPPPPSSSSFPPSGAGAAPSQLSLLREKDESEDEDEDEGEGEDRAQVIASSKRQSGTVLALCYRCICPSSSCASFFLPRSLNCLDAACFQVYNHRSFPSLMVGAVVFSCVVLAFDGPGASGMGPSHTWRVLTHSCEAVFFGKKSFVRLFT